MRHEVLLNGLKLKIIHTFFILSLLCVVACATIVWAAGWLLTKPVPLAFPITPSDATNVSFVSESGSELSGWLYSADDSAAIAVLMHGIRSNRGQMIARAQHLLGMNITTLIFDFQAHGESSGDIITLGYLESLDAQAALNYLKSVQPDLPAMVVGVSMGGAAALLANPALDVDVLIVESVYPDITTAISNRLSRRIPGGDLFTPLLTYQIKPRAGISASALSTIASAGRVKAATLVLNGTEDKSTTVEDTQRLFNSLPQPKEFRLIEGAGHVDLESYNSDEYWETVELFLHSHLFGDTKQGV